MSIKTLLLLTLAFFLISVSSGWSQELNTLDQTPSDQPAEKEEKTKPPVLTLFFTSDLGGRFLAKPCSETKKETNPDLLTLTELLSSLRPKETPSLVIASGGMLGPSSLSRFLLSSKEGAKVAAQLLKKAGIDLWSPGVQEFAVAKDTLLAYFEELKIQGAAALISNLSCAKSPLCPLIQPAFILPVGKIRVGVLSLLAENARLRVGPGHLHGAEVKAWTESIDRFKETRKQVDLLVAELDLSSTLTLWDAISFVRTLEAKGVHIDLVHLTRLDDQRGGVETLKLSSGTLILGTPALGKGVTQVSIQRKEDGSGFDMQAMYQTTLPSLIKKQESNIQEQAPKNSDILESGEIPKKSEDLQRAERLKNLEKELNQVHENMCQAWGKSIASLPEQGLTRKQMMQIVLDAMRTQTHAEISLINTGALSGQTSLVKEATVDSIGSAIPFKARVVSGMVLGQKLQDAVGKYFSADSEQKLAISGMSKKDGKFWINGRELVVTSTYKVTTIDFLLAGGNGLLPTPFMEGGQIEVSEDLLALVLDYMKTKEQTLVRPLALENKPLWTFGFDVGADMQSVTVSNPNNVYDRPLLSRTPSLAYKVEGNARIEMDHPRHFFQFLTKAQYGQSWLYTAPDPTMPNDNKMWIGKDTNNLISFLTLYNYRGFSTRSPLIPSPYVSLGLESEFHKPDTRSYTHMELSSAVGIRSLLPGQIRANAGIGLRSELLANPSSDSVTESALARARFLVTVGLEMPKHSLIPKFGDALLGEFLINYNYTDPTFLQTHEFRATGKLYLAIKRPLYLSLGADLYLFESQNQEPGISFDATAGLKIIMDTRKQIF